MQKSRVVIVAAILFLAGCAQFSRSPEITRTDRQQETKPFENAKSVSPEVKIPEQPKEAKVAVVFGPGGFKSFAHVGVLKEFKKANIPIHKVVGVEWGSLIAGLYAQRGQVHEVEWKLFKLEKVEWESGGFFASKNSGYEQKSINGFIRENIENKDLSQLAVPLSVPALSTRTGTVTWPETGSLQKIIESAIGSPPLFQPAGERSAGLFSTSEAVANLRREGFNVIILVNVLGDGPLFDKGPTKDDYAAQVLWNEVRRDIWSAKNLATDVIDVPTKGIGMTDFASRKILVTAGEAAAEKGTKSLVDKYGF